VNFLSRKMFQNGGDVAASGYVTYTDDNTKDFFTVNSFKQKLASISDSQLFALKNLSDKGHVQLTADLQMVLNNASAQRQVPLATKSNIGMPQSFQGAISDVPRSLEAGLRPVLAAIQRQIYSAEDIAASPRLQATQDYVSPIFGENFTFSDVFSPDLDAFEKAVRSGYRNPDEVRDILGGGDFEQISSQPGQFDFRDEDIQAKVSVIDQVENQKARNDFLNEKLINQYSPSDQKTLREFIDPITGELTVSPEELAMRPMRPERIIDIDNVSLNLDESAANLASLSEEIDALEDRFAEEDIKRPEDIDVDEITNLLNEIQLPGINIEKTEADSLLETIDKFEGLAPEELKIELDKEKLPGMTELDKNKAEVAAQVKEIKEKEEKRIAQEGDPDPDKAPKSPIAAKLKEPGFFGSDRFVNFVRNVGAGLVESGQMGPGLALGAAKAAEERAARDLAQDQKDAEMAKLIAVEKAKAALKSQEPMKGADIEKAVKFEDDLLVALRNFDEDERIVSDINQILNEDINDPAAFGARGLFGIVNDKIRNALGIGETEWANLPAEVRTKKLLDITAQRSVRSILGESGKTISNLDRQIVAQIFGNVDIWTSPAELRKILSNSRSNIIEGMRAGQSTVISRAQGLNKLGYPSQVIKVNDPLIARILGFSFDNIEQYKRGDDVSGFEEIDL